VSKRIREIRLERGPHRFFRSQIFGRWVRPRSHSEIGNSVREVRLPDQITTSEHHKELSWARNAVLVRGTSDDFNFSVIGDTHSMKLIEDQREGPPKISLILDTVALNHD
jgi:hypothetical protein